MANPQNKRLTGLNPLAYLGVEPITPPDEVIDNRVPTINDYDNFNLGTFWLDSASEDLYLLTNKDAGIATWRLLGGSTVLLALDGDTGTAVPSGGVITIAGGSGISTAASGSTVTITATGSGGATTFDADSGSAAPLAGVIIMAGGSNITTSASGNTVTYDVSGIIPIANGGTNASSFATTDGTIYFDGTSLVTTTTGGAGDVLTSNGIGVAPTYQSISFATLTFAGDSGTAAPSSGIITLAGGTGITTSASGSTVTINLDTPVAIADGGTNASSFATTDGTIYYDGTSLVTTTTGGAGDVLTSNGVGLAPTYQTPTTGTTTFNADSGSATPSAGAITFTGAGGITTSASGSTVTITGTGGGFSVKTTTFNASGTWTPDVNAFWVIAWGWGGGGGGASGRQGTNTTAGGGAGGASSGPFYVSYPISFFDPLGETVTIAAGGLGGASQGSANTNGNDGSTATLSYLGYISQLSAGASSPQGGTTGTALSQGGATGLFIVTTGSSQIGGQGTITDGTTHLPDAVSSNSQGGGGGGGADTGTPRTGGDGGTVYTPDLLITLVAGGLGGIETGTIDGQPGANQLTSAMHGLMCGASGGGGGGGQSSGLVAGNGGVGGFPGGGGGGGGGSINGTTSGIGGDGADGLVIVVEYLQ